MNEQNLPSNERMILFMKHYLKIYLDNHDITEQERKEYEGIEMDKLLEDLKLSRVLVTFQWLIWCILMHGNDAGSGDEFIDFAHCIFGLHLNNVKEWEKYATLSV